MRAAMNYTIRMITASLVLIALAAGHAWCGVLPTNDIVVSGGEDATGFAVDSIEIFNPKTLSFSLGPPMAHQRFFHAQVPLGGRFVLIAGGAGGPTGAIPLNDAELLDSTTGTLAATGSMATAHQAPAFAILDATHALIAGGVQSFSSPRLTNSAEIYSLKTGTFSATGNLGTARALPSAAKIGQFVLVTGGSDESGKILASAELYDSKAGAFSALRDMNTARFEYTITALNNRFALIAGGIDGSFNSVASAELFDLKSHTFSKLPDMHVECGSPTATRLNGRFVLITGGTNKTTINDSAELFDFVKKIFISVDNMSTPRNGHQAALITGGRVLVVGGIRGPKASNIVNTSEIFDPKTRGFSPAGNLNDGRASFAASGFH
jgi:hypothetical protein